MKLKLILLLSLSVLVFAACKKDDPFDPDTAGCADHLGTFMILPSSIEKVPYGSSSKVVFVDTFGVELRFAISSNEDLAAKESYMDSIKHCYTTHHLNYILNNDSLGIKLELNLLASPWRSSSSVIYVLDLFNITYQDQTPSNISLAVFYKILDNHGGPFNTMTNMMFDSMVILGRTFLAVEQSHYSTPHNWLVYNSTEGIVAFEDDFGNKWRFDRFE